MRLLLQILAVFLLLWMIVSVIGCNGSVPYCMGKTAKYLVTELMTGITDKDIDDHRNSN